VFKAHQLRYFVAVAEEGQVTRAAKKLHIAQPALSQAIAKLEGELGMPLLTRHSRGVTLTGAGEVLFERARLAVVAEREAFQTAESLARGAEGALVFGTVGLPPWLAHPPLIERFDKAHPSVEIRLREVPFPSLPIASWLAEVDVMISTVLSPDPNVWVDPLCTEPALVLMAQDNPLGSREELMLADLDDETFIRPDPAVDPVWAATWSLDEDRGGPPRNQTPRPSPSVQGTLATVASGRAVTISPASQAAPISNALPGIVAVPLRDGSPVLLSLVGRKDRCNRFVEELRDVARSLVREREPYLLA
jgi:DNA-binding transcriptional LysR family regulator